MGVPVDGGRAAVGLGVGLRGGRLRLLAAGTENGEGPVALRPQRDISCEPLTQRGGALQLVLPVGLLAPGVAQVGEHPCSGRAGGVAGGIARRGRGVRGAEVGAVAGERATHCSRASSRSVGDEWAVLRSRPRVIPT